MNILVIILGIVILGLITLAPNHLQDQTYVLTSNSDSTMTTNERILIAVIVVLSIIFVGLVVCM